jgi:hypothetical protein
MTISKYKLEEKEHRKLPTKMAKRTTEYEHKPDVYNNIDVMADQIIALNKSCRVQGLAGTGKAFLVKLMQKKMIDAKKFFILLAPTNKACNKMKT